MNIREPSTHLTRDKKNDDPLERILEPWGLWRQLGVDGLSSKRKSPLEGYNSLERAFTDELDRQKRKIFGLTEYRVWKIRIEELSIPRETSSVKPVSPKYGGHRYYSRIDQILSQIHGPYYNILIRKYEDQWEYKDFARHYGINENLASQRIFKARRAARKILKKNGYKA